MFIDEHLSTWDVCCEPCAVGGEDGHVCDAVSDLHRHS
jgi:hypothetical protein